MRFTSTRLLTSAFALTCAFGALASGCRDKEHALDARQIEEQYGLAGVVTDTVSTPDGPLKGTLVPITMANGSSGHLFIPAPGSADLGAVYMEDAQGLHPVQLTDGVRRDDVVREPRVVAASAPATRPKQRSWEREVLIVGGSAGAGAVIGGLAKGKKGAAVGATAGGVGGLIYDLLTRRKK